MAHEGCCEGVLNTGTPVGRVETLFDFPTYISDPPNGTESKATVVIFPDAFGWEFPNNRVLADNYAKRLQMRVLLPEMMDGGALEYSVIPNLDVFADRRNSLMTRIFPTVKTIAAMGPFLYRTRASLVQPRVDAFLTSLRAEDPTKPIGVAGFCWGAHYVFGMASEKAVKGADGKNLCDAGFAAHPSQVTFPADAEAAVVPISVAIGGADVVTGPEQAKVIEPIWQKKGGEGKGWEVSVIENARHGFAVRGDPQVKEEVEWYQRAEDQAVAHFSKLLASPRG